MKCPRCGNPGRKAFKGYCTKVHLELDKKPTLLQLNCAVCGRLVVRRSNQISKGGKVYCPRCPKNSGETHGNWKEGQYINPAGYRLILVKSEYKLEHRHTWELENKACLLPETQGTVHIHHINTIKTDNRPENLVLLTNQEHSRLHKLYTLGRYDEARKILVGACEKQLFFALNSEHLDFYRKTPLEEVMLERP